jgi:hypothetical protein
MRFSASPKRRRKGSSPSGRLRRYQAPILLRSVMAESAKTSLMPDIALVADGVVTETGNEVVDSHLHSAALSARSRRLVFVHPLG